MPPSTRRHSEFSIEDGLLVAAAVLLPWAFAGVELWAFRSAALLIVAAACIALWKRGWAGLGLGTPGSRWLAPAFLLAVWAAAQLLPLPPFLLRVVSPGTHRIYAEAYPGYPGRLEAPVLPALERRALEAAAVHGITVDVDDERPLLASTECGSSWRSLSVHPTATLERLIWYLALLAAFLLVRERTSHRRVAPFYRGTLFVLFSLLAVFALVQRATWGGAMYGLRPLLSDTVPFGPYVNPVHFAGAMELAVPWLAGCAWSLFGRARRERGWTLAMFVVYVEAVVLCFAAGIAAASKVAAVLLPAGLVALGLIAARTRRGKRVLAVVSLVGLVALVFVLANSAAGDKLMAYFSGMEGLDVPGGRLAIWIAGLGMWLRAPLTGFGFGAFREVFPGYAPAGHTTRWAQAHNDYLEVLLDGGLIAFALLAWLTWAYGRRVVEALRVPGERISRRRLGLVLGVTALALHALVDFNHQIPANALLFVVMAGMALPVASPMTRDQRARVPAQRKWILPLVAVLVVVHAQRAVEGFVSGVALARGAHEAAGGEEQRALRLFRIAPHGGDRLRAMRETAETRIELWDDRVRLYGATEIGPRQLERAAAEYVACHCLSPASGRAYDGLARVYHRLELLRREIEGDTERTRLGMPGGVALGMLELALARAPNRHVFHDRLALILRDYGFEAEALEVVRRSALVLPRYAHHRYRREPDLPEGFIDAFAEGAREALRQPAMSGWDGFRIALADLEIRRERYDLAIEALDPVLHGRANASDRALAALRLGEAYHALGDLERARTYAEQAVGEPAVGHAALVLLARLARERGDTDEALALLERVRWEAPMDLGLSLRNAAMARRMGGWEMALQTLRWAALMHPDDSRPGREIVRTLIEMGDLQSAAVELRKLEAHGVSPATIDNLRRQIEDARPRGIDPTRP